MAVGEYVQTDHRRQRGKERLTSWTIRHPETGRKALFVNSGFTSHIRHMRRWESRGLLDMLFRYIATTVSLTCRVRWEPNTLTLWDNRCTQHHAVWDYYPQSRFGERVSIVGARPVASQGR